MSVFGIGTNTQDKDAGAIKGKQIEIACECWFTKSGRTMPLLIKFQDEEGEIHTIDQIRVIFLEEKNYSGISSVEHDCVIAFRQTQYTVKLLFFKQTCTGVMRHY